MNVPFVLDGTVGHYILVTVYMQVQKVVNVYFNAFLREYRNSVLFNFTLLHNHADKF